MFKNLIKHLHTPRWLFLVLGLTLILRIPSLFEPYSYGDEMIYLTLGHAIRQGVQLYTEIHDNKPPLIYLVASLAQNLFWFKAILAIWLLITIFIFWKLTEVLFPKNQKLQKISTVIFSLLTTLPLLEGNIVNAELFMIGPIILGFFILLSRKASPRNAFLAGISFSIAVLFKVPSIFDIPAIFILWFTTTKLNKENILKRKSQFLYILLGFFTVLGIAFGWFLLQGAVKEFITASFLQNIGYLSSWRPGDVQKPFILRNLPLIMRGLLTLLALLIIYRERKRFSKEFIFVTSWLFLTLFAATLSERPYPHYFIQTVAPLSILISFLFAKKDKEQVFSIIPLFFAFLVPVVLHFWYYPTIPYYERFLKLLTGNITQDEYLASFGSQVPRNYKIVDFILASTKPHERVFVWGDSPAIYALSRRLPPIKYVADYHIKDYSNEKEIISALSKNLPSLIIVLPEASDFNRLDNLLNSNYVPLETIDGAEIWKLLNPKVRSLIS